MSELHARFGIQGALAFLIAAVLIILQMQSVEVDYYLGDAFAYLHSAKDLLDKGVFTDGGFGFWSVVNGPNGEGMFFAPLYSFILSGAMALDGLLYETVACHIELGRAEAEGYCGNYYGILIPLHGLMAIASAWLVWISAYVISGRYAVAWVAFGLGLMAEAYAYYTGQVMTENLVFPLFTLATLFFVLAARRGCKKYWLLAGLGFGLLALTRPSFGYVFYAGLPVALGVLIFMKSVSLRHRFLAFLALLMGYGVVVGPWVARNYVTMGIPAISHGYGAYTLAQRISFNDMSHEEWKASFVYGLPDFGDSLAADIYPPESYERLDYGNPDGFYRKGRQLTYDTLEAAGGKEHHQAYLIEEGIVKNLVQHVKVTFSIVWRSLWVSKYWGLIAIPVFMCVFIYALFHLNRPWWSSFVLFALPGWFMVGLHAFASVGVVRYNLILIPALSLAVAFTLVALWDKLRPAKQR